MKNKTYDIFISYRRDGGFETAGLIAERLKNAGYSVFLDIESLRSGKFNEQLYDVIENCKDVIVVLPENAMERCINPDDWLRLEITWAINHNKNIIPVMLRNFSYPEQMPEGLEELKNYQAVTASSIEFFDASIQKIKAYTKSKPGISIKKISRYSAVAIVLCAIIAGVWLILRNNDKKQIERLCNSEVILMANEIAKMNLALNIVNDSKTEWDKYIVSISNSAPRDTAFLRQQFILYIQHQQQQIPIHNPSLSLAPETSTFLTKKGIQAEYINVFYSDIIPSFYKEALDFTNQLLVYSRMPFISETVLNTIGLSHQSIGLSASLDYLGFLGFLTTLPKSVYSEDFNKTRLKLNNFNQIPVNSPESFYEEQQEILFNQLNEIINQMTVGIKNEQMEVEALNHVVQQNRKDFQNLILSQEMIKVNEKKLKLDETRLEITNKQKALEDAYEKLLKKCTFTIEEGEGIMWGKILRLITNARNTIKIRKESQSVYKLNRQEAIRNKLDPSIITEPTYSPSLDEIFSDIYKRLDLYAEYNQDKDINVKTYTQSTKQYLQLIKKGESDLYGLLAAGIENNAVHPVIKPGDIILERKGKPIRCFNDYAKLKDDPAPNVVKILRFNQKGEKIIKTELLPPSDIRISFMELTETDL